jgi:hypothetical protein
VQLSLVFHPRNPALTFNINPAVYTLAFLIWLSSFNREVTRSLLPTQHPRIKIETYRGRLSGFIATQVPAFSIVEDPCLQLAATCRLTTEDDLAGSVNGLIFGFSSYLPSDVGCLGWIIFTELFVRDIPLLLK